MKWTKEQEQAIAVSGRHVCVDAGAGSGKTSVLVERILRLLESGRASLDEIVAITFTEKAAGEMKDRLRRECRRRAPLDDPKAFSFWRGIERQSDAARITTIHSFCIQIVREHALRLGLDPDFRVLDESEGALIRLRAIQDAVHGLLDASDPAALAAAAELGTSKLMHTVRQLLRHRAALAEFLAKGVCTDEQSTLAWWRERLAEHEQRQLARLRALGAFDEAAGRLKALDGQCSDPFEKLELLRRMLITHLETLAGEAPFVEKRAAAQEIFGLNTRVGSKKAWASESAFAEVKEIFKEVRTSLEWFDPKKVDESAEAQAAALTVNVLRVYGCAAEALEAAKNQRLVRDFDDLILDAERILRDHEDLRARTAQGIKHLLIDEFQDTDHRQLGMALLLAEVPGGPEVFFVGDAKQSIYHFRGAEVEVFAEAQQWAGKTIRLPQNFRSAPQVLAFVDAFFGKTALLRAVEESYQPMQAVRPSVGLPAIEFLIPLEDDDAGAEECRRAEARMIAARLCALKEQGTVIGRDGAAQPFRYGDAAILMRAMSDVHLYEQALREAGVPYVAASGRGFYERQEVLDLRNLLAAVVDPYDEVALLGFLRGPIGGLSDEDVMRLCAQGPLPRVLAGDGVPEGLAVPERLHEARGLLAHLRTRLELGAGAFMRHLLACTGYEAMLLAQYLGPQKAANVRKLVDLAEQLTVRAGLNAAEFDRYLDEAAVETPAEGDAGAAACADAATLLTVHGAKGLEFPVVFVADASRFRAPSSQDRAAFHAELGAAVKATGEDGELYTPRLFAAIQDRKAEKEQEEHARLLYVAMTRARDLLIVGGAPSGGKGSWLASMDEAFGLLGAQHGAHIQGKGWEALVWREALTSSAPLDAGDDAAPPLTLRLLERARPVAAPHQDRVSFPVTAVARAMAGPHSEEPSLEQNGPAHDAPLRGAERGNVVHAFLERWDFRSPARPLAEAICREQALSAADAARMADDLCRIAERCAAHPLGQRIAGDGSSRREQSFTLTAGDALIDGQIDLLLSDGTLVDYKAGRINAGLKEQYVWQVRLYALAASALDGAPPAAACLYYVDQDHVEPVDIGPERLREAAQRAEAAVASLRAAEVRPVQDEPFMIGVNRSCEAASE